LLDNNVKDDKEPEEKPDEENNDPTIENKDVNALSILESAVEAILEKTFYQSADGKWNLFDEDKGEWVEQIE
jgi:hypothetical protein